MNAGILICKLTAVSLGIFELAVFFSLTGEGLDGRIFGLRYLHSNRLARGICR